MKTCTWNVRSIYRAEPLKAAVRELERYKFDVLGVQVRWDKEGTPNNPVSADALHILNRQEYGNAEPKNY